jgi:hypothetical protein
MSVRSEHAGDEVADYVRCQTRASRLLDPCRLLDTPAQTGMHPAVLAAPVVLRRDPFIGTSRLWDSPKIVKGSVMPLPVGQR